jgi:hypothetical protein
MNGLVFRGQVTTEKGAPHCGEILGESVAKSSNTRPWRRIIVRMPLVLEAFLYLLLAKAAVRLLPFTLLRRFLAPPSKPDEEASTQTIASVSGGIKGNHFRRVEWVPMAENAGTGHTSGVAAG